MKKVLIKKLGMSLVVEHHLLMNNLIFGIIFFLNLMTKKKAQELCAMNIQMSIQHSVSFYGLLQPTV